MASLLKSLVVVCRTEKSLRVFGWSLMGSTYERNTMDDRDQRPGVKSPIPFSRRVGTDPKTCKAMTGVLLMSD